MTASLRTLLNKHIFAAQALLFRSIPGGLFELMPEWARGYSGLHLPVFNVFIPRKAAGLTDETLADTAAFFSSRNALYAVELMPDFVPKGADFLNERRYNALPPQPALILSNNEPIVTRFNPAVTVAPVRTVPEITAFCSLQHQVFDFDLQDMLKRFPVTQLQYEKIVHFLAFLQDEPVGTATVICADGVASIWHMGTVDAHRGLGVATTLMSHMLDEAKKQGCRSSLLFSTAQAYKFFAKMGFEIFSQRQWFLPENIEYDDEL